MQTELIPGLPPPVSKQILSVFQAHESIREVKLFGSRAKNTMKPNSDIDICIMVPKLSLKEILTIEGEIDDLLLPWSLDLVQYDDIENQNLKDHINRVGLVILKTD